MNRIKFSLGALSLLVLAACGSSKDSGSSSRTTAPTSTYWQQHIDYDMDVDMDVNTFKYTGTQDIQYTNNSPDTLQRVFFHLYYNAFQPGSEMDVRSRTIADPDGRVGSRISKLSQDEIGMMNVTSLTQNGVALQTVTEGTVLEVDLAQPILPGTTVNFKTTFQGQVPKQIRRSGRDNAEGVALSMVQWYPKMAEYDFEGWHADPYIGREFHGVWGDYDVSLTLDADYTVGATGYIQNPKDVGHGYNGDKDAPGNPEKLTWNFVAPDVHDFAWAADPDYVHDIYPGPNGVELHFLYKDNPNIVENWKNLQPVTAQLMKYFNANIGEYPYKQYSVMQGGDGGMEYAMSTLITGERKFNSLVGVTAHELAHTWFQFLLATNEARHEWMDEGFTTYISNKAMAALNGSTDDPLRGSYQGYLYLANSGDERPLSTQADRYHTNRSYGISAYSKGAVFLGQLEYIIGEDNVKKTLKRYFDEWAFKHPTPNDFIRVAEKVSGLELEWYLVDFTQTREQVDYGIESVSEMDGMLNIELRRDGMIGMPIDLVVTHKDGSQTYVYVPLRMMRGEKPNPYPQADYVQKPDWPWAMPTYRLQLDELMSDITKVEIDPSMRMADVDREDNVWMP